MADGLPHDRSGTPAERRRPGRVHRRGRAAADADGVDFTGYDLIYVVPARNQTAIASSPELNNYEHQIVADGNDLGNGDDLGSDMFSWGYKLLNHETGHAFSLAEGYNAGTGGSFRYMGPVGHDGQHHRQRAGLHRLEQVEARLAQ